jgi:RNA polymerase sigma factor (sigma-70 family)
MSQDREQQDLEILPLSEASEATLLAQANGGDTEAFEQLISPYLRILRRLCMSFVRDHDVAEDVVVASIEEAWWRIGACKSRFGPWLLAIARNRALDRIKYADSRAERTGVVSESIALPSTRRAAETPEIPEHLKTVVSRLFRIIDLDDSDDLEANRLADYAEAVLQGGPAEARDLSPRHAAIVRELSTMNFATLPIIANLPNEFRSVIELRNQAQLEWNEMAAVLQTSPDQAREKYESARTALKNLLEAQTWDETPYPLADIEESISQLPSEYQSVLQLRYYGRLSWEDVAATLGISTAGARKIHERAVKHMLEAKKSGTADQPTKQDSNFGEILRQYRLAARLSQEDLANRTGLSVRGISDLERGVRSRPHFETVRLIADALDLTQEERVAFENSAISRHS